MTDKNDSVVFTNLDSLVEFVKERLETCYVKFLNDPFPRSYFIDSYSKSRNLTFLRDFFCMAHDGSLFDKDGIVVIKLSQIDKSFDVICKVTGYPDQINHYVASIVAKNYFETVTNN